MKGPISHCRVSASLAGFLMLCSTTSAQPPTSSLADVSRAVSPGAAIEVKGTEGSVVGRLISVSETSVVLDVGGKRAAVPAASVSEIAMWQHDSLKNGIIIGSLVGVSVPLAVGIVLVSGGDEVVPGDAARYLLMYGGLGAAIGAGIDAMHRKKVSIFRAAVPRVEMLPILTNQRKGFALAVRFN